MALSIGQLLGGAGVIASRQRQAEEAERVARQNQLLIEEQNRLNKLRQLETQSAGALGMPQAPTQFVGFERIGAASASLPVVPAPAAPTPTAVAAPAPTPTAAAPTSVAGGDYYEGIYNRLKGSKNILGMIPSVSAENLNALRDPSKFTTEEVARLFAIAVSKKDSNTATPLYEVLRQRGVPESELRNIQRQTRTGVQLVKEAEEKQTAADEERRRLFELRTGRKVSTATKGEVLTPGANRPGDFDAIAAAVKQVESGGDPNAVSPKGAVGTMQTMPGTLKDPGFGVTPARNRTPQELERVGRDYLRAMIREFNGNLDHALAAYNWGPDEVKKWIARGANANELPSETRNYIQKVKGLLGSTVEALIPAAEAAPAAGVRPEGVSQAESPSAFYAANPQNIGPERQNLDQMYQQQRARIAAQYNNFVQAGMGPQANQLANQVAELDQKYRSERMLMDGMEALAQLEYGNDPRAISQVLSFYRGQQINYEPLADGTYRMVMQDQQGNMQVRGVYTKDQVKMMARQYFDRNYVQAQQAFMSDVAKMRLESELKRQEGISAQQAQTIREVTVEIVKGNVGAQARAGDFVATNMGDGQVVISNKSGTKAYIINTSTGQTVEIDGTTVPVTPSATAVMGMGR